MPVYEHEKDQPESVEARAAQDDPSVMYLVVRKEHGASLEELLVAAAHATLDATSRYAGDPRYADEFAYWSARSFRKVCLRANEKDWPRVMSLDAGDGAVNGSVVVRALPPRRRSAREKLLVHLQAYAADPGELPRRTIEVTGRVPVMVFVVNAALTMSAGKMAAQVGHAALLAAHAFATLDVFAQWDRSTRACVVRRASGEAWEALKREERCAIVRDAGLTEIAHGSETVLVLAPCPPDAWSERVALLPA